MPDNSSIRRLGDIALLVIYSIIPYTQRAKRNDQQSQRKTLCRDFAVRRELVIANGTKPDTINRAITLRVRTRFSLKAILPIAKIIRITTRKYSLLNSLPLIHARNFQINTNKAGTKEAIKTNPRFHGYGQFCTAETEKKIMNTVDKQYV
ncbi:MAG: hypothetical protein ACOC6B_01185 [Thermodesulfobacteriota bacterium]